MLTIPQHYRQTDGRLTIAIPRCRFLKLSFLSNWPPAAPAHVAFARRPSPPLVGILKFHAAVDVHMLSVEYHVILSVDVFV